MPRVRPAELLLHLVPILVSRHLDQSVNVAFVLFNDTMEPGQLAVFLSSISLLHFLNKAIHGF